MLIPLRIIIASVLTLSGLTGGLGFSSDDAGDATVIFLKANDAFEAGNYPEAIKNYESLISGDRLADSLYLNMGTSHFRNGSPGRAALWFRRAAQVNPGMPEVKQNFEFLRRQQGLLEFSDGEWEKVLLGISPSSLRWGGSLFLWATLFSLVFYVFGKRTSIKPVLIISFIFAGIGAVFFFWLSHYRAHQLAPENFATVVVPETSALIAPAPDSAPVIALPEGSEVRILEDTGPWLYASIPGDLVGWIHHTSVEKNWPIPAAK